MQPIDVDIAIVVKAGQVLICQRHADVPLGGYWEFPGGKRKPDETSAECAIREVREEVGLLVRPYLELPGIEHAYPHGLVRLHAHVCHHLSGEARPLACQQTKWVHVPTLDRYTFPPANTRLIEQVIEHVESFNAGARPS